MLPLQNHWMVFPKLDSNADYVQSNCRESMCNQLNVRKEKGRRVELRKRFREAGLRRDVDITDTEQCALSLRTVIITNDWSMYRNSRWLLIIYNEIQVRQYVIN